jgi:hypothetical protein
MALEVMVKVTLHFTKEQTNNPRYCVAVRRMFYGSDCGCCGLTWLFRFRQSLAVWRKPAKSSTTSQTEMTSMIIWRDMAISPDSRRVYVSVNINRALQQEVTLKMARIHSRYTVFNSFLQQNMFTKVKEIIKETHIAIHTKKSKVRASEENWIIPVFHISANSSESKLYPIQIRTTKDIPGQHSV